MAGLFLFCWSEQPAFRSSALHSSTFLVSAGLPLGTPLGAYVFRSSALQLIPR